MPPAPSDPPPDAAARFTVTAPDDTRSRLVSETNAVTTRPTEPLPEFVGEYKVVRLLGEGGMGRVYAAEDPHLRREVAVKVMKPELAADATARERFLREARAQAAVQHDHVAVIHLVGVSADGTPFLVLPLLGGETLAARLARTPGQPLPVAEVLRIGRETAAGLAAAHARGLVHRDVKPSNVWLDGATGAVRVLDFGLARSTAAGTGPTLTPSGGGGAGTPAYMAPEQASGREANPRADLFSLGATLFETATGRRAFPGRSVIEVLTAVATHTPPPVRSLNPLVPDPLARLIAGLLAKDPAARTPATASGVSAVLRQMEDDATKPYHPPTPTRGTRWPLIGAGVVAVIAVAAVTGWFATRPPPAAATPTTDATSPPVVVKYTGSVDIRVERGGEKVPLSDPRAMPLKTGDLFVIDAEVTPAAYLYLFWIDETGKADPIYPGTPGEWGTRRPADETPTGQLTVRAPGDKLFQITGDADAMETIVMLARPGQLTATDEQVKGWFAGLEPLPTGGPASRIWFENFEEVKGDAKRAVNWTGEVSASPPVRQQEVLRQRIGPAGLERAITFARLGPLKK